jgi:predicted dehydrogenase
MKVKIGIAGCGRFSTQFIPLFKDHPLVEKVALCDLIPERANDFSKMYQIKDIFYSYEELLKSDINCVYVCSQRQLHAPMVLDALDAGKHVFAAVPIANSIEDIQKIVEKVESTGLTYMTVETSYYYACTIFCRKKFKEGLMGDYVYGEARYFHDMMHFYDSFKYSGGENWKQVAGLPPMYYPTHSVSMILSVTGAKVNKVSCSGFVDHHEDGTVLLPLLWVH